MELSRELFGKTVILTWIVLLISIVKTRCHFTMTLNGTEFILPIESSSSRPMQKNFSEAEKWCRDKGSTLAEIRDKAAQQLITEFLYSAESNSKTRITGYTFFLGGKYYDLKNWYWVNGRIGLTCSDPAKQTITLWAVDFKTYCYSSYRFTERYICETAGNSGKICDLRAQINGRCFSAKNTKKDWYEARNDCLDEGGDLASFDFEHDQIFNQTIKHLIRNQSNTYYWIGLRKREWKWIDTGYEIKYTNWLNPPNDEQRCLHLLNKQVSTGWKWEACDCDEMHSFICATDVGSEDRSKTTGSSFATTEYSSRNEIVNWILGPGIAAIIGGVIVGFIAIIAAVIVKKRKNRNDSSPQAYYEAPRVQNQGACATNNYGRLEMSAKNALYLYPTEEHYEAIP